MNFFYASDPNWGRAIAQHMQNILPYNKKDYTDKMTASTLIPSTSGILVVASEVIPAIQ
jgi:hypothetical protein